MYIKNSHLVIGFKKNALHQSVLNSNIAQWTNSQTATLACFAHNSQFVSETGVGDYSSSTAGSIQFTSDSTDINLNLGRWKGPSFVTRLPLFFDADRIWRNLRQTLND